MESVILIVFLICLAISPFFCYFDAAATQPIILIYLASLLAVVAIGMLIMKLVISRTEKRLYNLKTALNNHYSKEYSEIKKQTYACGEKIQKLTNDPGFLTQSELNNIFTPKPNLSLITDKEIDDLFIWLAHYPISENEYKRCWLYKHYETHINYFNRTFENWHANRRYDPQTSLYYFDTFEHVIIQNNARKYTSIEVDHVNKIISDRTGSWKNLILRATICACILGSLHNLTGTIRLKNELQDIVRYQIELFSDPNLKATNKDQNALIGLVEKGLKNNHVYLGVSNPFEKLHW